MTKKSSFILMVIVFIAAIIFSAGVSAAVSRDGYANAESVSFYDETAAPTFYGATKITLTKDAVSSFSVNDSRFRIFAKDYEDGDVTPNIVCERNDVDPKVVGEYSVRYAVTDKHGNTARITVPVTVLDETGKRFVVQRTVYAVPAMKNLSFVGTERCNTGDRQILGIFLPEGATFSARSLSSDAEKDFEITFFTNTRLQNSFSYIHKSSTDHQTFSNKKGNVSYAAVPLITSPRLSEERTDVGYNIEICFDKSAKPLDYYHYKDDEQAFVSTWKQTKTEFGVVDGEAMLVIVPFADVDKLSNYQASGYNAPFPSLDAFFEYYKEVMDRMDAMIGLSFTPTNALDRNYRIKYTCAADAGQAGVGAYYGGGFIAVGSSTAAPFFQYGWGTLHEIAHGYQGYLGRGNTANMNIGLNETGNNVLAYYIQNDRTIYKGKDNWLGGSLSAVEKDKNALRLNGGDVFVATSTYVNASEKLYALINLFNSFEGSKTYGKLFSFYRALAAEKGVHAFTTPDLYAKFFAKEYGANVIPYLKAWKLTISDAVDMELSSKNLVPFVIPSDVLDDEKTKSLLQSGKLDLLYAPVPETELPLTEETELTVTIDVDDFYVIKGRNVGLYKGSELVRLITLETAVFTLKNLTLGAYRILVPPILDYDVKNPSFVLSSNETATNELVVKYEKIASNTKIYHPTKLRLLGIYNTDGFSLALSNDNKTGSVSLGGANMGNQNAVWAAKPDDVFASVAVLKQNGESVVEYAIKGNGYFSSLSLENKDVALEYGYKIRVFTHKPEKVGVWSLLTMPMQEIPEYKTTQQTTEYLITENGLKKLGAAEFNEDEILYETIKTEWINKIDEYSKNITPDEAKNLRFDPKNKREILRIYQNLKPEDRDKFDSFCETIAKGNPPRIIASVARAEINIGDEINLLSLISVSDAEDLFIDVNGSAVTVKTSLDTHKAGIYPVEYTVRDADGNTSSVSIEVEVKASAAPPSTDSGETNKPQNPDVSGDGNGENNGEPNVPPNDKKLQKGAIIGIVVSVAIALVFGVLAIVLLKKKSRKKP